MPMCGVMGDNELFDFFVNYHLVAQVLTGFDVPFPFPSDYTSTTVPAMRALLGTPFPSTLTPLGQKFAAVVENLSGGDRPMFEQAFRFSGTGGSFLFAQGVGFPEGRVSNVDTVFQIDSDPALTPEEQALNADITRVDLSPQARHPNGLGGVPAIQGNLRIPVLSLHTLGDLFVPFSMEQIYAREVAANGDSDLLVTRAIRDINHCGFAVAEMEQGFAALVDWVVNGNKPAGDDILTPAVVAHPDFSCAFTVGTHALAPACP
jgi:hypothetical protein